MAALLDHPYRTGELWHFSSDLSLRRRLFVPDVFSHPAKIHLGLLQKIIDRYTQPGDVLFDPMAGTGSLMLAATQQRHVILRDLMPEYVELMRASQPVVTDVGGLFAGDIDIDCADAKAVEVSVFDHIVFSPPYGFETGTVGAGRRRERLLSVKRGDRWREYFKKPRSASFAAGFRYAGGRANTGNKSGRNYWEDMRLIYQHMANLAPSGGLMILVLKNHYRRGQLRDVVGQTVVEVGALGFSLVEWHGRHVSPLSLWQRRRKEQGWPVVEVEDVLVFERKSRARRAAGRGEGGDGERVSS